ncbi:MAG TPA: hypothetical protein VME70_07235 [Mycobacteriales bacterium]|nr:hypothetical protein [Mycobacteriales bacterium]
MAKWSGQSFELDGDAAATAASMSRVVCAGSQTRVLPSPNGLLLIEDKWRPHWAWTLAILLFPFGLLALFYRKRGQLVMSIAVTAEGRSTVTLLGETGRRTTTGLWQIIGETLADDPDSSEIQATTGSRWSIWRRSAKRWARMHPWPAMAPIGTFALGLSLLAVSPHSWGDAVGAVLLALLLSAAIARGLRLWPNNRVLHWHAVRIPPLRPGQSTTRL